MQLPALASLVWILAASVLPAPATGASAEAPERDPVEAVGDWRNPARWRALRVGMSRADVLRLLGEPGKVTTYYGFERWEYPDALGHRVNFDERGRLAVWGALAR